MPHGLTVARACVARNEVMEECCCGVKRNQREAKCNMYPVHNPAPAIPASVAIPGR
jgi:hypothetical protein